MPLLSAQTSGTGLELTALKAARVWPDPPRSRRVQHRRAGPQTSAAVTKTRLSVYARLLIEEVKLYHETGEAQKEADWQKKLKVTASAARTQ